MPRIPLSDNPTGKGLILSTLALLALGVVLVHSALASASIPREWYTRVDFRHTAFAGLAFVVMLLAWRLDYRWLLGGKRLPVLPTVILGLALLSGMLVFVPGVGHSVGGDARWIRIGPSHYAIGFQPSEVIKLAVVIFLAAWLSREQTNVRGFLWPFLPAMALIGMSAGLVITQDFGTAVLICCSATVTLILAGVPLHYFLTLIPPAAAAVFVLVFKTPHRMERINAFLTSDWGILHANPITQANLWQPQQSLVAILRGGWFGQGVGNGITKMGFLPEDTTDFIFAVFCEEWGFVGAMLLIGLVVLFMWQSRKASLTAGDKFGRVLAGSLGFIIAMQAVLHVAVDLVAIPPTGMSFPFLSAGGTSLVIMAGAVALMVSVTAHRAQTPQLPDPAE